MSMDGIVEIGLYEKCCRFNKYINCDSNKCGNCGWNPKVSAKRIDQWCKDRAANKC